MVNFKYISGKLLNGQMLQLKNTKLQMGVLPCFSLLFLYLGVQSLWSITIIMEKK